MGETRWTKLKGRRRSRRGRARYCCRKEEDHRPVFQAVHDRHNRNTGRLRHHRRTRRRAERTNVRAGGTGRQVGAKMELRREKYDPEEQRQNADSRCLAGHVLTKTKLRQEWLRGQAPPAPGVSPGATNRGWSGS